MIRLATIEDQSALVRLCKKDAWDGTTILSAFQSKCADVYNADWQYCDIWMGTSDAQNKNAQYVLCRLGQTFHIVGKPHSKQRWEELYSFLSMQAPKSKLIADSQMIAQYQERFPSPACTPGAQWLQPASLSPLYRLWSYCHKHRYRPPAARFYNLSQPFRWSGFHYNTESELQCVPVPCFRSLSS